MRFIPNSNSPENWFAGLLAALAVALTVRATEPGVAVLGCLIAGAYGFLWPRMAEEGRARLLLNFAVAWLLYGGSSLMVEAMRLPLHHHELLAADTALFGGTPAVMWRGRAAPWLNDTLSAAYLSYHVYINWAVIEALARSRPWRARFNRALVIAFVLCMPGYFLFPSATPASAFPELFPVPVAGGFLTKGNAEICAALAARYDAFPSLHVFLTLTLLAWDWRMNRARFWIMLVPALLMAVSTLALRYHFAVDLIASAALFGLWWLWAKPRSFSPA